jgi:hypothetical protein
MGERFFSRSKMMICRSEYTRRERIGLWILAAFGFTVVNAAFLYGVSFGQNTITATLKNPIALAFIMESLILLGQLFSHVVQLQANLVSGEAIQFEWRRRQKWTKTQ